MRRIDVGACVLLLGLAVVVLAGGVPTAGSAVTEGAGPSEGGQGPVAGSGGVQVGASPPEATLVEPGVDGSALWPYTSRTRSTTGRTLAINVVVTGDADAVRTVLADRSEVDWTVGEHDQDVGVDAGDAPWQPARGAARYSYVRPTNASTGTWVESSYQLGAGTYFGKRYHVRAYPTPTGNWTALQAHAEYWDWFRLRHTVTDIDSAAAFVETDLQDEPVVGRVAHRYHGRTGGWSDGWLLVVEFAATALAASVTTSRTRADRTRRDARMAVGVVGVVLAVRWLGIGVETLAPTFPPKVLAGVLYPVLVLGPPLVVARFGRTAGWSSDETPIAWAMAARTGVVAGLALAVALVLDPLSVGTTHAPWTLVRHRLLLVLAFGALAASIRRGERLPIAGGVVAWLGLLAAPLFGFV